jgi:hypothetical protein
LRLGDIVGGLLDLGILFPICQLYGSKQRPIAYGDQNPSSKVCLIQQL